MGLNSIWKIEGISSPITSNKDKKLEEKMKSMLLLYLHQIEELSFHTDTFRNPDLSIENIADALKIPNSQINYIINFTAARVLPIIKRLCAYTMLLNYWRMDI
jgi:hypothetical protein